MELSEIIKFWDDVKKIRMFDMEVSANSLSESSKEMHLDAVRNQVNILTDKYVEIEGPEKEYLVSLVRHYGLAPTDSSKNSRVSDLSEHRNILNVPIDKVEFLPLGVRNALKAYLSKNYEEPIYFGQIISIKIEEIKNIRGIGKGALDKLEAIAKSYGYELGQSTDFNLEEVRKKEESLRIPSEEELNTLDIPVSDFNLSKRAYNILKKNNILYLGDVVQKQEKDFRLISFFGKTSLDKVRAAVASAGYSFETKINYIKPEDRK